MNTLDPNAQLHSVFKKIEQKLENEKKEAQRAIELEKYKQRQIEEERIRRRQERIAYACVFVFLSLLTTLVYIAHENGVIKRFAAVFINSINNGNSLDCEDPNNWKLPVCTDIRKAQIDAKWSNMSLSRHVKEKPFAILKENKSTEGVKDKADRK